MPDAFVFPIAKALSLEHKNYVVLGDPFHGSASLISLAKSFREPAMRSTGVNTVLVEGFRSHQEPPDDLREAVNTLKTYGVRVIGAENDNTERFKKELDDATEAALRGDDAAMQRVSDLSIAMLSDRLRPANDDWARQARNAEKKVVICCGASHLPRYLTKNVAGLIELLGDECAGFAVVDRNHPGDSYMPEDKSASGEFGSVKAISVYN